MRTLQRSPWNFEEALSPTDSLLLFLIPYGAYVVQTSGTLPLDLAAEWIWI